MPTQIQVHHQLSLLTGAVTATDTSAVAVAGAGHVDLHVHSCFSDGIFDPDQLATLGSQRGLRALALTDHDTVDGCELFATACAKNGLEFVPATELTSEYEGAEVHILGYYIDIGSALLRTALARAQTARKNRVKQIVMRLNRLGIPLAPEAVFASGKCSSPGRPHIARALVQAGLCAGYQDAFERYIGKNKPAWVPNQKMPASQAIELIHAAGGLAIMAHPGLNGAESALPGLIAAGLDGIECYHTKHSKAQTARYVRLAARHKLLVTGGSDCHGEGEPLLGTVNVPYTLLEQMKSRTTQPLPET